MSKKMNMGLAAASVAGLACLLSVLAPPASAQIKIGLDMALTGPTATVILPHQRAWSIVPKEMAGVKATYPLVDDHGDPTLAVQLVRRLISEDKVDAIVSAGTIPICAATARLAVDSQTPVICAAPVVTHGEEFHWMFTAAPAAIVIMKPAVDHMKAQGAHTIGYLGFSDSLGDVHLAGLKKLAAQDGLKVVVEERFDRTATSITGQALHIVAAKPDAVFIGASGTPAAFAQKSLVTLGYKGPVYHTNAIFTPAFTRVGGKAVQGAYALSSPFYIVDQLPDSNINKPIGLKLKKLWDSHFPGADPGASAAYAYDSYLMLNAAAEHAIKIAKPGTAAFRVALRDGLEHLKELVGASAVFNTTPTDHNGADSRSAILVQLHGNDWKIAP